MSAGERERPCSSPFSGVRHLCDRCRDLAGSALRPCGRLVAQSGAMRALLRLAALIVASDAPVVIAGETGTGKEVVARALHASGPRSASSFVAVNCGAMPADLIESELFGHVRGAFSGAVTEKRGLFEEANGGTILLDEIGDLPLPVQVKLLRVLQDGEVRRVGATTSSHVDVRVIAATHRDLAAAVKDGSFREDLYYRLKVFGLRVPALRDRPDDILPLATDVLCHLPGPAETFDDEAAHALLEHRWPGNVRELVNAVRHAGALAKGPAVTLEDLPAELVEAVVGRRGLRATSSSPAGHPEEHGPTALEPLATVERRHILAVVEACRGNQTEAARVLGIARNTLWRKLEAFHRDDDFHAAQPPGGC
ncbi:MAG TPA: sigma-54 dependent transcriptional regulator [Anaeromyxobacteraceae bacterium]|nr:sigma-54 dependent transcriptional regulator [Anaeromyxobacteraceae bacterium]